MTVFLENSPIWPFDDMSPSPHYLLEKSCETGQALSLDEELLYSYYGEGRNLSAEEGRALYKDLAIAVSEVGMSALIQGALDSEKLAKGAFETRHSARNYIRARGSLLLSLVAQLRDLWKYGSSDGPSFEDIQKRYQDNPLLIIQAAGRSNKSINQYILKDK